MDPVALGKLAERAAALADEGGPGAAAALSRLVAEAARSHRLAPAQITALIASEWDRLGIRRVPGAVALPRGVPRGTHAVVRP